MTEVLTRTTPITDYPTVISLALKISYTARLAPKQKVALAAAFSLGILVIIVAVARVVQVSKQAFGDGVLLALWGTTESTLCEYRRPLQKPSWLDTLLCAR